MLFYALSAVSFFTPKLSDSVDSDRVPMGSAGRMGRRNFSQAVSTAATIAG
jgi:hypothetical protein